ALVEIVGGVARGGAQHVLVFIQAAGFNQLKADLGINGADQLLADLANRLKDAFIDAKVVARFQDDVFTVLCDAPLNKTRKKVGALINAVSEHLFELNNQTVNVQLHAGMTGISDSSGNSTQILTQAHEACMMAVRDNVSLRIWEPGANDVQENNITSLLRSALDSNTLQILFQPILNLRQGSEESYETLVRMRGENDQLIEPQEFLDAADVLDLAGQLDRWVFSRAVAELSKHRRERGTQTRIFIHLTASSVQDSTFLPWVNKVLRETRIPGDAIVFQISERVMQSYLKIMKSFAKGLNVLRIGLAVIRFGDVEKADLMFRHLRLDYVKLDPSVVKDLDRQANQLRLTKMLAYIHEQKTSSIVPHIESAAILGNLWQLGVHYVQGYYLQAPAETMDFHFEEDET
ncbi:MAG: GGDEF domain-containing protein, partial [Natronospirillum sp.]